MHVDQNSADYWATEVVKYTNLCENVSIPFRHDPAACEIAHSQFVRDHPNAEAERRRYMVDDELRKVHKENMMEIAKKKPKTFYDRVEVVSAALQVIYELQYEIGKLPANLRSAVHARIGILHQESMDPKNRSPEFFRVPDQSQLGRVSGQAQGPPPQQPVTPSLVTPPNHRPQDIKESTFNKFRQNPLLLLNQTFQRIDEDDDLEIFKVTGLKANDEATQIEIKSSLFIGEMRYEMEEFWGILEESKMYSR